MYYITPTTRELLFLSTQLKANHKFIEGINYNPNSDDFNGWFLLNQNDNQIAVTPLFHYDTITTENSNCIINNNVLISDIDEIGDNIALKSDNKQYLLIYNNILLSVTRLQSFSTEEIYLVVKTSNEFADILPDLQVDVYYSTDNENFNLINTIRTDENGCAKYLIEDNNRYYKFKYKNFESEVIH